ncbi:MAG TPA: S9 family peptidase, partial [Flavobacteriales bacterium]|nr:S9 family peptidase [Flavobacteriales bacterium]
PPVYTLKARSGRMVRALKDNAILNATLAKYNLQPKEFFTFKNDAGDDLNAWMIKPPDFDSSLSYPVYVAIYGGP